MKELLAVFSYMTPQRGMACTCADTPSHALSCSLMRFLDFSPQLGNLLIKNPMKMIPLFDDALRDTQNDVLLSHENHVCTLPVWCCHPLGHVAGAALDSHRDALNPSPTRC